MNVSMPTGKWEVITPEQARIWLSSNTDQQHSLKHSVVVKYARDMVDDNWKPAGDPIRIDVNGRLVDGQHRLKAISAANKPQIMFVLRNVSPDSFDVIDTGSKRSPADAFVTSGRGWLVDGIPPNTAAGTIAVMLNPNNRKGRETRSELMRFADQHADAIKWTFTQFKAHGVASRRVFISPVAGAVARAFYHVSHERLARFVQILVTGIPIDINEDKTVLTFRNWVMDLRNITNSNGREEIYLKTSRMIVAYDRGERISKIYAASTDPFPIPDVHEIPTALQFAAAH